MMHNKKIFIFVDLTLININQSDDPTKKTDGIGTGALA